MWLRDLTCTESGFELMHSGQHLFRKISFSTLPYVSRNTVECLRNASRNAGNDRLRQTHTTNRMRLQRYNLAQAMPSVFHRFFAYGHKKRSPKSFDSEDPDKRRQLPTLPHCIAVPSAQAGLTSLFGMGRGGTPPLSPPDMGDMRLRYRQIS